MQNTSQVTKNFCTGSSYRGEWNVDMTGVGVYKFADGTEYHGTFKHGLFHGNGIIITPSKFEVHSSFDMGKMVNMNILKYTDNLPYTMSDWKYLQGCDRRYARELENGIPPVGDSYETNKKPARNIPENYYDCTNSFYLPEGNAICNDNTLINERIAPECESKFIQKFYRNTKTNAIGYNADIMEADNNAMKLADCVIQTDYNLCKCAFTNEELMEAERNRINYLESISDWEVTDCQCSGEFPSHSNSFIIQNEITK